MNTLHYGKSLVKMSLSYDKTIPVVWNRQRPRGVEILIRRLLISKRNRIDMDVFDK